MKILPVKLPYSWLLAAALLSAGAGLIYGYANYNDCRCNQASPFNSDSDNIANCCSDTTSSWYSSNSGKCSKSCSSISCTGNKIPSGAATYTTDSGVCCKSCPNANQVNVGGVCKTPCANVTCSGGTPQKNPSISFNEDGSGCCMAAPANNGTIHIGPVSGTNIQSAGDTYTYGLLSEYNSSTGGCTVTAACTAQLNSFKTFYTACATNPASGAACNTSTFQPCYLTGSAIQSIPNASGGFFAGTCIMPSGAYNCQSNSFHCEDGCDWITSGTYSCRGNSVTTVVSGGYDPAQCYKWLCFCYPTIVSYATCS